eukprot:CAMPEP_0178400086 /NCGR_PEP_ID=MMETSP0689_2-20121128/15609_1 /TAXON_ID=160604 /ORGANISM="Amphidinium massartii, Strain CS-259" /LENGTH=351 /DNA_ID=CAMNT_0020020873 /DNA_START=101 /DNA_END=1156 /DNA_ORIENTATION=-
MRRAMGGPLLLLAGSAVALHRLAVINRAFVPASSAMPLKQHRAAASSRVVLRAEEAKKEEEQTGHQVNTKGAKIQMDPEEAKIQEKLREHQQAAPKLGAPVEVRTLVEYNHGYAVISTNSVAMPGYPGGSVVGFAPDDDGRPLFFFSTMSTHTTDLLENGKCSLTVASKEFKGAADGRVNLLGEAKIIDDEEEREAAKAKYRKKHPDAFWIEFGDFKFFRMEVEAVRFVGGFARAGSVTAEEYSAAKPDPIAAFGPGVAGHMNDDHREATIAMVGNYIGIDVEDAEITSMDSLGMYVKVKRKPKAADQYQQFKLRLPFIRPLETRKDAKDVIVEMTRASAEFMPKAKVEAD